MTNFSDKTKQILFFISLILVASASAWYLAVCTSFAPWGFSDSTTYFTSARNLANGTGLGTLNADGSFSPLQVFAPLFSIVLSLFAKFGADLIVTSRILDILFFATLVISSGWIFYRISESTWPSFFFALLIATTPALMSDYSSMMSEPLAIVLGLPGFLLLLLSIKLTSRKLLVFSAVLCGLALMTRYAFVAFPMAGVIVLLLLSTTPWRRRFLDTIIYGLIGFLPMLLWILQQLLKHASIGSRDYSLDILVKEKVIKFSTQVINVTKYWFPYRSDMIPHISAKMFNPILGLFFVALIGMGIILAFRHRKVDDSQRASWVLICGFVLLLGMYGVGLLTTYMVSTDLISLNDRMFSPAAPMVYGILMACALTIDRKLNLKFSFPLIGLVVTLFFVVFNFLPLRTYLINVSTYPDGYASPDWKDKPILTELKKIPSTNPILSNAPDIILFYTNHNAYYLSRAKKTQGSVVTLFDLERLRKLMSENCGVLVLFDPYRANAYEQRPSPITRPDMTNLFALYTPIYDSKDGTILVDQKCIKP